MPLAFGSGCVAARLVGFDGCLGDLGGFASSRAWAAANVELGAGILMIAAVGLTP